MTCHSPVVLEVSLKGMPASLEPSFVHVDASGKQTELPYKVSGPDFYKLSDGRLSMPLPFTQ